MALAGYKTTITVNNVVAGTLRDWLAANLTTWTVGALATYSSGDYERNYFLLTHTSGVKILVFCPNGQYSDADNSIYSGKRSNYISSAWERPLAFCYDPKGEIPDPGSVDPAGAAYWDGCLGASHVNNIDIWIKNTTQYLYVMEDATIPVFCAYCSTTNGLSPHGFVLIGEIYTDTYDTTIAKHGFMLPDVTTGTPVALASMLRRFWRADNLYLSGAANDWNSAYYNPYQYPLYHLTNTHMPLPSGKYLSAPHFIKDEPRIAWAVANPNLFRAFSATTETFGQKSSTRELIHLYNYILTPWPTGMAIPGA